MHGQGRRIALTMGDPGGIGPEVILKALREPDCPSIIPVVIGDPSVFTAAANLVSPGMSFRRIGNVLDAQPGAVNILPEGPSKLSIRPEPSAESGRAVVACIRRAVHEAQAGRVHAVVTSPISKKSLSLAGYAWPGHTELLAELTGTKDYAMMLVGGPLRVMLVTIHEPLSKVPALITRQKILRAIRLAHHAARSFAIDNPRIAVAGLNPHAGEEGVIGPEERNVIAPAIEEARAGGLPCSGPWPPDVVFRKAYEGRFDVVVCMYHDQGLIPLKMIAFDTGVNLTVGLPIIRTSPDHGTAFNIAWQGGASGRSMLEAIRIAVSLKHG